MYPLVAGTVGSVSSSHGGKGQRDACGKTLEANRKVKWQPWRADGVKLAEEGPS